MYTSRVRILAALLVPVISLAWSQPVLAVVRTWTGLGTTDNWSTTANWAPAGTPANGDDLVFPAGAARLVNTNNVSVRLNSISFNGAGGGYVLRGNTISLTNGITASHTTGANRIDFDILLGASQTFTSTDLDAVLTVNGDISLGAFTLTMNPVGTNNLGGAISGTGGLTKNGNGRVVLNGSFNNTFTGVTRVNTGTLQLSRFAIVSVMPLTLEGRISVPGDLIVGNGTAGDRVEVTFENQIADTSDVTVNEGATLELVNVDDAIGALTMQGGTVETGTGLLTLGGNLTSLNDPNTAFINGNLSLGGASRTFSVASGAGPALRINANISSGTSLFATAGFTKTGGGVLWLDGANTYNGTTLINDGQVTISSDRALGAATTILGAAAPTVVNGDATLFLAGVAVTNEDLTLNTTNASFSVASSGVNTWAGDITLNTGAIFFVNATSLLIDGAISGAGSFTKNGLGTLTFDGTNANTYAGTTTVNAGTLLLGKTAGLNAIPGDLVIGDDLGGINADVVRLLASNQIINSGDITINSSGLLDLDDHSEGVGPLTFREGAITTGTGLLSLNGNITATGLPPAPFNGATISGRLNLGGVTRTINTINGGNAAALQISATISGTAGFTKTGNATLSLTSSNSYSGVTTVADGNLSVSDSDALGSFLAGSNNTIVQNGASLVLSGEGMVLLDNLELHGLGAATLGALWTANGTTNTYGGIISIIEDTAIGAVGTDGRLIIPNRIAGAGGFTKVADGTVVLAGTTDNTYAGATIVNSGTLELAKNGGLIEAIAGSALIVGDGVGGVNVDVVRYTGTSTSQIFSSVPITVNSSGLLDLNGHSDDLGSITLNGGDIHTGTGTATVGNITATETAGTISFISGHLIFGATRTVTVNPGPDGIIPELRIQAGIVGGGGLIKAGDGHLSLSGSNNYAGLTTVNDGVLWLEDSFALGSTSAGTVINSSATLRMSGGIHVPSEQLTLGSTNLTAVFAYGGSNSWAGNIILTANETINVPGTDSLNLSGSISGSFGITKIGTGTLWFRGSSANTYTGDTRVNEGTLSLAKSILDGSIIADLFIGDGLGGALSDVVRIFDFSQISSFNSAVTIASSGLLDLNDITEGVASIAGSGRIDIGNNLFGINGSASTTYSGLIVGTGNISKTGLGTLTLTGNNTYSGQTLIADGTLRINGSQPASYVVVTSNGRLEGNGVVGNISISANIAPGTSPGVLTCSNLYFAPTADFFVEINGPNPGTGYDQLNVRGTNQLGGATLHLSLNYAPSEGERFTIISNDLAEAVVGTFAGLPNGSVISAGGRDFRVHYNVGNNDVVLVSTNIPAKAPFIIIGNPDHDVFVDINECSTYSFGITNLSAAPMTGISARLESRTSGVAVTQPFSTFPNVPVNGRGTNIFPFQISTMANFLCGADVQLALVLETASHGSFTIPITLGSGHVGSPVRFNNNTATPIPDLGTLNSLLNVSGITTPIRRVTVSMHITHTSDNDLDISLISPSGLIINLSSDNGGTSSDYGTGCEDTNRTTFADAALTSIISASAPFVGTFRPESGLFNFNDLQGSDVNGTWTLRVADDTAGGVGTLRCWSLFISPTECNDAGGPCESCPERTIFGFIGTNSTVQAGRLTRDTVASVCGFNKPCPNTNTLLARFYDAFTFVNGESNACISVTLQSAADLFSVAYRDSYNPANLCQNYLADMGDSTGDGQTNYAFRVAAGARFVVVVVQVNPGDEGAYRLDVTGGSCRPSLNITYLGGTRVLLDWSTSAVDFDLERTGSLVPGAVWTQVPTIPFYVQDSRYVVTNNVSPNLIRFFRLHKP
jgi:autotransporter-associated beta strand protein